MSRNTSPPKSPPQWADRLLEWFCAPTLIEEIQGDLHEQFYKQVQLYGERKARQRYILAVFGFFRPFIFKKDQHTHSNPDSIFMFKHYLLTTFRQIRHRPGISLSYLVALTLGITTSLIIFLIIRHENSFDTYHSKSDRIYRVDTERLKEQYSTPGTPTGLASVLENNFTGIEKVAPIKVENGQTFTIQHAGKAIKFKEKIAFAKDEIFQLLDFRWIEGQPAHALAQPNQVVLTKKYAEKFFGKSSQAIGKTIRLNNIQELIITGVIADYPANTDFSFDMIASYPTIKSVHPDFDFNAWNSINDAYQTFVLLKEGVQPVQVERFFPGIIQKNMDEAATRELGLKLVPLAQLHFSSNFGGRTADKLLLESLQMVAIFILLLACINFINLATAQGAKRAKEVGVRKVLGSNRRQVIYQFFSEACIITLVAVILSLGVAFLALPHITQSLGITIDRQSFLNIHTFLFLLAIFGVTSFLAGFYPAFVLSKFSPVKAMKNGFSGKFSRSVILRNGLVVFQFSVSLVFIIGTLVVNKQLRFFRQSNLGFNKEAILTVEIPDNQQGKLTLLRQQLLQLPQIQQVSFSLNSASAESNWMQSTLYKADREEIEIRTQMKWVDAHFIPTYGIELLAGEMLQEGDSLDKVLVNEVYLQRMKLSTPEEAIGKVIYGVAKQPVPIIGVVKNFHVNSLHQQIDPTILAVAPQFFFQGNIKIHPAQVTSGNVSRVIAHLQKVWTATFPEYVFTYQFLDQTLEEAYKKEIQMAQLVTLATGIAIIISCLGLFGLAIFTTQQRVKEIGIRKVLGASVSNILLLLSGHFFKLILLANIFAWPIAWWLMSKWLENFAFPVRVSAWLFLISAAIAIAITVLTISFQSIKAAVANPVKSLRSE